MRDNFPIMARRGTREPAMPATDEWKDKVRARIKELGLSYKDLAETIGCVPSMVTLLLSETHVPPVKQTSLVPAIHRALGWPPPGLPIPSGDLAEINGQWDRLSDAARTTIMTIISAELKKK